MILETWIMAPVVHFVSSGGGVPVPVQPLRLLRLLRLTRMARLMRSLPELVTMTKGMKVASRAVLSSLLMVALMIYTFSIVLNLFLKEELTVNTKLKDATMRSFVTIPHTMWTLLMDGTFMDSTGTVLSELLFSGKPGCWLSAVVFMVFILFSAITVMNMLIGVLCEVVSAVAQGEKDDAAIRLAKESILLDLKKFDNGDNTISKSNLMQVFKDKQSRAVLKSLNIDRLFLLELQQMLFPKDDSVVSIKVIMELMLMCRGDLAVTVQHIASAQASLFWSLEQFEKRLGQRFDDIGHKTFANGTHPKVLIPI
jgi:hypothetical protein